MLLPHCCLVLCNTCNKETHIHTNHENLWYFPSSSNALSALGLSIPSWSILPLWGVSYRWHCHLTCIDLSSMGYDLVTVANIWRLKKHPSWSSSCKCFGFNIFNSSFHFFSAWIIGRSLCHWVKMNWLSRLQLHNGDSKIVGKTQVVACTMSRTRGAQGEGLVSQQLQAGCLGRFQAGSPLAQYNLKVCLAENGLLRKVHVAVYHCLPVCTHTNP